MALSQQQINAAETAIYDLLMEVILPPPEWAEDPPPDPLPPDNTLEEKMAAVGHLITMTARAEMTNAKAATEAIREQYYNEYLGAGGE